MFRNKYICKICKSGHDQCKDLKTHFGTEKHLKNFNVGQRVIVGEIMDYLSNDSYEPLLIEAMGGSGKTFCVQTHCSFMKNLVVLGPTNAAVRVLKEAFRKARTFHSFFGYSLEVDSEGYENNVWSSPTIPKDTLFILDEISMMNNECFSLFKHYILGKYKVIMMGDRAQIPCMKVQENRCKFPPGVKFINQPFLIKRSLFFDIPSKMLTLTENVRSEDKELTTYLTDQREKVLSDKMVHLKDNWEFDYNIFNEMKFLNYILVAYRNVDVDFYNNSIRKFLFPDTYKN